MGKNEDKSKISVFIDKDMYRRFKGQCALNGVTITDAVNQLIADSINRSNSVTVKDELVNEEKGKTDF